MKIEFAFTLLLLIGTHGICQVPVSSKIYFAKEFSKEISLYRAKSFLIDEVLGSSNTVVKFSIDPLAAAKSGDLTSLSYECEAQKKEGLILGFYGNRWSPEGATSQAYGFKHLPKEQATEILTRIGIIISENFKFLNADDDNNNIYLHYQDMTFLVYKDGISIKIRVFWGDFDSEWEWLAYKRTRKRLLRNLD